MGGGLCHMRWVCYIKPKAKGVVEGSVANRFPVSHRYNSKKTLLQQDCRGVAEKISKAS